MSTRADPNIAPFLRASHRAIDRTLEQLLEAVLADDQREIAARWARLDADLLAHMEAEEHFVLPAFARIQLDEASALLREHATLRQQLLELGVAAELHCLRADKCRDLVAALRIHAEREDALLYKFIGTDLDAAAAASVRQHIDAAKVASAA